ncbi:hypothetical protein [Fusobacterium animalis]|uniref:hypothetical protein n=2 Tax=Fusobacterium animalis TaxID=76859 RepID=UPI0030D32C81
MNSLELKEEFENIYETLIKEIDKMEDLEIFLIMLSFLIIILYLRNKKDKKDNSVIITDENFNKIDLIKLFNREIRRNRKIRELYNYFEIIKNLTKEEEKKLKIFLKENKTKYKELNEVLEKVLKIKTEKIAEYELKRVQRIEENIREIL